MKFLAECDKCFKKEQMERGLSGDYYLPNAWQQTDIGDLCDDCYPKYKRLIGEWSVSKK